MKRPRSGRRPNPTISAFWTATTGASGEAVIVTPTTVGPDPLVLVAPDRPGGGAGAPACPEETCAAAVEPPRGAGGDLAQTGVSAWASLPSTGKRPATIAARPLIIDCGVAAS